MKILVIHNILWAHYKSVLFEEIQKKIKFPHEFHVLQIARNEISRKNMEGSEHSYSYNYTLLFDDYIENVPKLNEIVQVLKFVLNYRPDVINVTGYSASVSTLPVILLAKLLGIKVIMSNESTGSDNQRKGLKEFIKRAAIRACSGFVVFGKSSEKYVLDLGAGKSEILVKKAAVVDNKAIREIYNDSLQAVSFPEITTPRNFIFVGRMAPEKNTDLLIRSFQSLVTQHPEWGLIMIGNGTEDGRNAEIIRDSPSNIYTYDAVSWNKIPRFFTQADCLVLPSSSEPWGLVVNEAMVCGLSVIVTDVCGCAEDLVKDNGYIIRPNDASALRDAMQKIITHNDLDSLKKQSEEIISQFSAEEVAKEYVNAVTNLH